MKGFTYSVKGSGNWMTRPESEITGTEADYALPLTGLDPDTDYEFIAFAQNSAGRGDGARLTFHTPAAASPGSTLDVSPTALSFAAAGEAKTLQVAANVGWTASSDASWLTVSPASGTNSSTVTATATANTSASQRAATITVTGGGITRTLGVTQAAGPVTQPGGNNALSSLSIEGVALSPQFNPSVTDYRAAVPNAVTSLTVRAQAEDAAGATVAVTGSSSLQVGENTVAVRVTAANGSVRTYTVTVTRDAPTSTEAVATAPRAWSSGGILYVSVPQPSMLQVYTLTGIPAVNRPVPEGQTAIPLPRGIYIVCLGDRMTVKVPVK
jgi:hypothetical protein